jgi:hypothetical protein
MWILVSGMIALSKSMIANPGSRFIKSHLPPSGTSSKMTRKQKLFSHISPSVPLLLAYQRL